MYSLDYERLKVESCPGYDNKNQSTCTAGWLLEEPEIKIFDCCVFPPPPQKKGLLLGHISAPLSSFFYLHTVSLTVSENVSGRFFFGAEFSNSYRKTDTRFQA